MKQGSEIVFRALQVIASRQGLQHVSWHNANSYAIDQAKNVKLVANEGKPLMR